MLKLFPVIRMNLLLQMQGMRREGETKKEFYVRLAQSRKEKWGAQYRNRDDHYKFHFLAREDQKTKLISKSEPRCEQRIRNRMAAQQSRERHRSYVEELQRKAKIYDQLVEQQQLICKHCRQNLLYDVSESEERSLTARQGSTEVKQQAVETYLNEQVIRIDNGSATSPFGIFFIVCVVAVLAIASLNSIPPSASTSTSRLLQTTTTDAVAPSAFQPEGTLRSLAEYIKSKGALPAGECVGGEQTHRKNLRSSTGFDVGWTKMGEFICSTPTKMGKTTLRQDYLMSKGQAEQIRDNYNQEILTGNNWERVEVSQCFRGIG